MKGDIILTRDVEVVEMRDLGTDGAEAGAAWNISAPRAEEEKTTDWVDGFRRAERRRPSTKGRGYQQTARPSVPSPADGLYDMRAANAKTANTALARDLKGRHLQMIAFGGAIGTLCLYAKVLG